MLSLKATKHHGESGTLIPSSSIQCSVSIPGFVKNLQLNNGMLSLRWMLELFKTILWFNIMQIKGQNNKCKFSSIFSRTGKKKKINMNNDRELSSQGTCGKWWLAFPSSFSELILHCDKLYYWCSCEEKMTEIQQLSSTIPYEFYINFVRLNDYLTYSSTRLGLMVLSSWDKRSFF